MQYHLRIKELFEHDADEISYRSGLLAQIQPPVNLSTATAEQYLQHGRLDPTGPTNSEPDSGLTNPMVVGSSDTLTAIYAQVEDGQDYQEVGGVLEARVRGLLGIIGVDDIDVTYGPAE